MERPIEATKGGKNEASGRCVLLLMFLDALCIRAASDFYKQYLNMYLLQ
jgi:hypothetical protein